MMHPGSHPQKGQIMSSTFRNALLVLSLAGGLAACGNDKKVEQPGVVMPPPVAKTEDAFGTNFGIAFRAAPHTEAKDPVAGDIIPLTLTRDPVQL